MTPETLDGLKRGGYLHCRQLPNGVWIGLHRFLGTVSLCVGLDEVGLVQRYRYREFDEALAAVHTWNGEGDPPGPWMRVHPWRCRLFGHKYAVSEGLGLVGGVRCVRLGCGHRPKLP